jgi:hypothetical protein
MAEQATYCKETQKRECDALGKVASGYRCDYFVFGCAETYACPGRHKQIVVRQEKDCGNEQK